MVSIVHASSESHDDAVSRLSSVGKAACIYFGYSFYHRLSQALSGRSPQATFLEDM